ncbi:PH domain-containing protein [Haloplanus natans]|uniref:PH domain-containing protein n=1 Tax=Haloplanus natans TaxID=376171 RepID=UPI000677BBCB|nr:PH domain-containing protein [Haloplanus natans]
MDSRPDWLSIDSDETVVWRGAPRIRRVLPTAAVAALWIALLALGATLGPQAVPAPASALPGTFFAVGAVLLALPAIAAVVGSYLRTTHVEYVLTDRGLYRKAGVVSMRVFRVGLSAVERTSLSKGVWGNLFDYGTISISTAGSDGVDLQFTDLDDPGPVRTEIRRLIGADRTRCDAADAPIDAATVDALLDEFGALRAAATRLDRTVSER